MNTSVTAAAALAAFSPTAIEIEHKLTVTHTYNLVLCCKCQEPKAEKQESDTTATRECRCLPKAQDREARESEITSDQWRFRMHALM